MQKRYYSRDTSSSFMSLPCFIEWWFGWASHFKIDFRQQCPWCDGCDTLACDGTNLGLGFAHTFVEPIEKPVEDIDTLPTKLRRLNRCFVQTVDPKKAKKYQTVRAHLRYICDVILKERNNDIEDVEYLNKTNMVRETISNQSINLFNKMETSLGVTLAERKAIAKHFKQLSFDCSVDTFIPLSEASSIIEFIIKCRNKQVNMVDCLAFANRQHSFNAEIAELLSVSIINSIDGTLNDDVLDHLNHLAEFVTSFHDEDTPPAPIEIIEKSYNPCKFGRALYFQKHGSQVRNVRKFSIDNERKPSAKKDSNISNYDDEPSEVCSKIYPQAAQGGNTYLFLWFCPNHGHCYGFHIIPGSEGRKDPAAALYTHLETPPTNVFYDHACSLSEYVKNRESGYFNKTRFFHDVFHGFSHKCSSSFRCVNINLFDQTNTSICEQFNSYIQRIKSTAKHLSQAHFTFYVQFFIHQWNKQQEYRFAKKYKNRKLGNIPEHENQNMGLL